MSGFVRNTQSPRTPNYYRSHLGEADFRRAMEGAGPLTVTQIAAMVSDKIPPEAKRRYADMQQKKGSKSTLPLEGYLFVGVRRIVQLRMPQLIKGKKIRKHGRGKGCQYEWIATQDNQAGQDSA